MAGVNGIIDIEWKTMKLSLNSLLTISMLCLDVDNQHVYINVILDVSFHHL
jgi:hypothetical protein